jgi:DNA-binding response OmpR family regulator
MSTTGRSRILYASHDCDTCKMFTDLFRYSDIDVACAGTIKEALKSSEWIEFDAYLLGIPFDHGSSIDLCRSLRALNPRTPIVFYAGEVPETTKHEAFLAGADGYVDKAASDKAVSTITNLMVIRRRHARLPFKSVQIANFISERERLLKSPASDPPFADGGPRFARKG